MHPTKKARLSKDEYMVVYAIINVYRYTKKGNFFNNTVIVD